MKKIFQINISYFYNSDIPSQEEIERIEKMYKNGNLKVKIIIVYNIFKIGYSKLSSVWIAFKTALEFDLIKIIVDKNQKRKWVSNPVKKDWGILPEIISNPTGD